MHEKLHSCTTGDVVVLRYEDFNISGGNALRDPAGTRVERDYGATVHVVGKGSITRDKHCPYAAYSSTLAGADLDQLVTALTEVFQYEPDRIFIAENDGYLPSRPGATWSKNYYLTINDDHLAAVIEIELSDASKTPLDLDSILHEIAERNRVEVVRINTYLEYDGSQFGYPWEDASGRHSKDPDPVERARFKQDISTSYGGTRSVGVLLKLSASDKSIAHLVKAAEAMTELLSVTDGNLPPGPSAILAWLRSGHEELLMGLQESQWLEVKSAPYRLKAPGNEGIAQKVELAEDVARLVNGEAESILLIGFSESARDGDLRIDRARPIPLDMLNEKQYANVLDERVFPAVRGLQVHIIKKDENSGFLAIHIPRQPSEMIPYLVSGAIVGDRYQNAFFSVVQRRGEGSIPIGARELHTYIVAGRAFLRQGLNE
ncbi:hypothetical protein [Tsukamurella tyrosinosolvens]|uniref:hypothetical protein n=1 Tax=Tsukamurella tyrosinosolvens TaxID=57704 RepID=UPI0011C02A65|nr:hypothetical protein [Tsukamurella tyrosinosolvens]